MKKVIIVIIVSLIMSGAAAIKVNAEEMKFGFIDLNEALNESDEGKKAVMSLESLIKSKQKIIEEKEVELNSLKSEIMNQTAVLNSAALKKKQEQHDELLKVYQRMVQDSKEEIQKKQSDFMKDILVDLRKVIADYGKREGYTAIFEKYESGLLYMPDSTDLTDKIIETFNNASREKN